MGLIVIFSRNWYQLLLLLPVLSSMLMAGVAIKRFSAGLKGMKAMQHTAKL